MTRAQLGTMLPGAVLVACVALLGWRVFPRTAEVEGEEERAEQVALDEVEGT